MPIYTGHYAKGLKLGVDKWWAQGIQSYFEQYAKIYEKRMSSQNFEEHVQMENFPIASVKLEGQAFPYATSQQGFIQRYVHVTYGLGYAISREAIEDNKYVEIAQQRTKSLMDSMNQCKEVVAWQPLNRAFSNTTTYGDGVELCSTANLLHTGGTYSNKLPVDADLNEAALEDMLNQIGNVTGENGIKVALMGNRLIVPIALQFEAARIMKSLGRVSTADNDINAIKEMGMLPGGIVVSNYLTDNDAWFVQTNAADGLIYYDKRPMEIVNDTPEFDTEVMKFKATMRFCVGVTNKLAIFGSAGA